MTPIPPAPEEIWVIKYDDADVSDEVFVGEGAEEAAKKRYAMALHNWNCHLLVPFERIAKLTAEVERLEQWKREQLLVESKWNPQEVGRELGIGLGNSIRAEILPAVLNLKAENARLKAPVSDEEWDANYGYEDMYGGAQKMDRIDVYRLITSRATRTPPQADKEEK